MPVVPESGTTDLSKTLAKVGFGFAKNATKALGKLPLLSGEIMLLIILHFFFLPAEKRTFAPPLPLARALRLSRPVSPADLAPVCARRRAAGNLAGGKKWAMIEINPATGKRRPPLNKSGEDLTTTA